MKTTTISMLIATAVLGAGCATGDSSGAAPPCQVTVSTRAVEAPTKQPAVTDQRAEVKTPAVKADVTGQRSAVKEPTAPPMTKKERAVQCGRDVCRGTEECCASSGEPLCVAEDTCIRPNSLGGIAAYEMHTCDGPEDCGPNQFCCEFYGARGGGFSCWEVGMRCDSVACHGDGDCARGMRCAAARDGIKKCVAR